MTRHGENELRIEGAAVVLGNYFTTTTSPNGATCDFTAL